MSFLDRLLGKEEPPRQPAAGQTYGQTADEQAIARYLYMLRTAPPETIEAAHREAFERLTPEQRRLVLEQLRAESPERERAAVDRGGDDPQALARLATRAELRQPGTMERTFGRLGGGSPGMGGGMPGMGGLLAGSFLSSMAGTVIGSVIAQQFFSHHGTPDLGDGAHHGLSQAADPGNDAAGSHGVPAADPNSAHDLTADTGGTVDEVGLGDDLALGGDDFDAGGFGDSFDA